MSLFFISPRSLLRLTSLKEVKQDLSEDDLFSFAKQLKGFSSREIEKFVIYAHDTAFNQDGTMDASLMNDCL